MSQQVTGHRTAQQPSQPPGPLRVTSRATQVLNQPGRLGSSATEDGVAQEVFSQTRRPHVQWLIMCCNPFRSCNAVRKTSRVGGCPSPPGEVYELLIVTDTASGVFGEGLRPPLGQDSN